ncbi:MULTISPECIES: T9SS type A sorting domain-containing protein [Reichenbachiella]|uniref:T9SS type A sorting domain-containing protein n=1 Tax=Reichenbachiella TaxID=156993 RepID=UPI000E6CDA7D|nr:MULTISPECIES: T9SS type A sorting domain-containing protein [Reichenbachiella]MBU2913562.1 T9SS type A sorting domain-containing protein [Reichenbachiella agariperforans]RJE74474.1 hypothetical protein BGP76_15075 [Reichenbachiella sp. MSK19-1]
MIYPNPTTGGVAWQGFVGGVLNVTVFSLSGNQVCAASGTTEEVQVQISQCLQYQVNGKYIMQFQSPTDRYQTLLITD